MTKIIVALAAFAAKLFPTKSIESLEDKAEAFVAGIEAEAQKTYDKANLLADAAEHLLERSADHRHHGHDVDHLAKRLRKSL